MFQDVMLVEPVAYRPPYPRVTEKAAQRCLQCPVRALSVCNAIQPGDLAILASASVTISVAPGGTFVSEGDEAEHFFVVTAGTAKVFKLLPDGRRQITGFATPGDFLGFAAFATYSFGVEAVERVRLCRFTRARMHALLNDFPALEKRLLEAVSNELIVAQEQMLLLGRKTARERVATFLLAQEGVSRDDALLHPSEPRVLRLPMARRDIAEYVGLTTETVSRTITWLKKQDLINLVRASTILIRDPVRLQRLATGLP